DLYNDQFVMLVNERSTDEQTIAQLEERVFVFLQSIDQLYGYSLTAVISSIIHDCDDLPERYGEAYELSDYRLLLGKGSIIRTEKIQTLMIADFIFPDYVLKKQLQALFEEMNLEQSEKYLKEIISILSSYSPTNIRYGLAYFLLQLIERMNA